MTETVSELVGRLRGLCVDWNGTDMRDDESPRVDPTCGELRRAATALASAEARTAELTEAAQLLTDSAWESYSGDGRVHCVASELVEGLESALARARSLEKQDG